MSTPPPAIPTNGSHKSADNEKVCVVFRSPNFLNISLQKNRFQAATTVFVGSISDRAPDIMIKRMLQVSPFDDHRRISFHHDFFFCSIVVMQSIGNEYKVPMENYKVKNSNHWNWSLTMFASLAFGFCEYENPEGTLRCIRLLNGLQIQDKKLVVSFLFAFVLFFRSWKNIRLS